MWVALLSGAGGCSFEVGVAVPIETNAVDCDCVFVESGSRTLSVPASTDDAEQLGSTTDLTSNDLDLDLDHLVGLRFPAFGLPAGAVIESAHVQFTADDTQNGATTATIRAQVDPAAPTFAPTDDDLSGRIPLPAPPALAVAWTVPPWTEDDAGAAEQTPDLSPLLQELVDLPGWTFDSAVVLIVDTDTGDRTAESFDGTPSQAPTLVVTYTVALSPRIPTCATDLERDVLGFLVSPQATCDTLEATLGGLNEACGLPHTVECTLVDRRGPDDEDVPDSYQSPACEQPCTPDPVDAPACPDYDPAALASCLAAGTPIETCKAQHASATHAGDDTPVCVASGSALAFHALGRRSTCEVEGTSEDRDRRGGAGARPGDHRPDRDPRRSVPGRRVPGAPVVPARHGAGHVRGALRQRPDVRGPRPVGQRRRALPSRAAGSPPSVPLPSRAPASVDAGSTPWRSRRPTRKTIEIGVDWTAGPATCSARCRSRWETTGPAEADARSPARGRRLLRGRRGLPPVAGPGRMSTSVALIGALVL